MPNSKPHKSLLSNTAYDIAKDVTTLYLPALGTLYFALASIWGLPAPEQVVGTIAAVVTFLGVVLKISTKSYNTSTNKFDGKMVVDTVDPTKDVYRLELDIPLEQVEGKNELTLKVEPNLSGFAAGHGKGSDSKL